jgi:type VI secretion system secreted protein VgrG
MASAYSQENRFIQISVTLKSDDPNKTKFGAGEKLLLENFYGQEGISIPFHFDLVLRSVDPAIKFSDAVGQPATIKMICAGQRVRYINGIINTFTELGQQQDLTTYQATLSPELWLLTRNYDCRIFQKRDARQIILTTLKENGVKFVDDQLTASRYKSREYCVQYNETDFDFISRLMEEEGIFYFFVHEETKHTLVLADQPARFQKNPILVPDDQGEPAALYRIGQMKDVFDDFINYWNVGQEVQPQIWVQRDYNFKQPGLDLTSTSQTGQDQTLEVYEYPGLYEDKARGQQLTDVKMEQVETAQVVINGGSTYQSLMPGFSFKLSQHFRDDFNANYVPTSVYHIANQGGNYNSSDKDARCDYHYNNTFCCIPSSTKFRPPQTVLLPNISSTQTAIVVGRKEKPKDEEIYADEFGRVKVRFYWDRRKQNQPENEDDPIEQCPGDCSCWVRVAQPWAGNGWGHQWIPRIGQEVVVTFLEGNPDRPLITGCVYNGDNAPPYALKDHGTQSGIKTHSTPKGTAQNFNEIRFEDKKGSEDLLIHAESTMHNSVEASQFITVGSNRHITTGGIDKNGNKFGDVRELVFKYHNLHVKTDQRTKIEGNSSMHVQGDFTEQVEGYSHLHVQKDADATYDQNFEQSVSQKCVILADTIQLQGTTKLVLMAGTSSIVIDASGVTVLGTPMINLNSPGAPPTPEIIPLTVDPDDPDDP